MENPSGKSALGLDPNVAAGIAYIPFCAIGIIMSIIILVTDKTNKFARFHAFQSLLLLGVAIVLYVVAIVIFGVAAAAGSTALSLLATLVWFAVIIGVLIAVVLCCIQAFMGKSFKLPIIGNLADNWSN